MHNNKMVIVVGLVIGMLAIAFFGLAFIAPAMMSGGGMMNGTWTNGMMNGTWMNGMMSGTMMSRMMGYSIGGSRMLGGSVFEVFIVGVGLLALLWFVRSAGACPPHHARARAPA